MKRILPALLLMFLSAHIFSQYAYDRSVMLDAKIDKSVPSITLTWNKYTPVTNYQIYRKAKASTSWYTVIATVPGTDSSWTDTNVTVGNAYEYRVVRGGGPYVAYGYIYSGMDYRIEPYEGKIIVLIDSTLVKDLDTEINLYLDDLVGDGWMPIYHVVSPTDSVKEVKALIQSIYNLDPANTKSVFLLGHIPVPYSGNLNPDGHPDHQGAWPADSYYGDMNGTWTDNAITIEVASDPRNINIPGDGKFDQSYNASPLELQVGRVDFTNLPAFGDNAPELTRKYLIKNHAFRTKEFVAERRGLLQDNFNFSEGFSQSAYKSFSTMFGKENVFVKPYLSTLTTENYLWSYGCGGGNYQAASGIASSYDFAVDSIQSVFTQLFGSYFGDWDSQNNFLRSALATGTVLTDVWGGRPNFHFHHMALGETIGYDVKLTQNNNYFLYDPGNGAGGVHVALMGDPTLKLFPMRPVTEIVLTDTSDNVQIEWPTYNDAIDHYEVYSRNSENDPFQIIKSLDPNIYTYTDSCVAQNESIEYMVRAVALETTASGTYFNLSKGARKSITPSKGIVPAISIDYIIVTNEVTFSANGNANAYSWNFGDGTTSTEKSPVHVYDKSGEYTVILNTSFNCTSKSDTFQIKIILTSDIEQKSTNDFKLYPTIANTEVNIEVPNTASYDWDIVNVTGLILMNGNSFGSKLTIPINELANGIYYIRINTAKESQTLNFTVQR